MGPCKASLTPQDILDGSKQALEYLSLHGKALHLHVAGAARSAIGTTHHGVKTQALHHIMKEILQTK